MKTYKLKLFAKWAKQENIGDSQLSNIVQELERGLMGAHLGNGLYKKRAAKEGAGKRSGHRCLLAFKTQTRTLFLFGFSKNEKSNINTVQLKQLKQLSKQYLTLNDNDINKLVKNGNLIEVE